MNQSDLEPCFWKDSVMGDGVRSTKETKESWRTIYGSFSKTCMRREAEGLGCSLPVPLHSSQGCMVVEWPELDILQTC